MEKIPQEIYRPMLQQSLRLTADEHLSERLNETFEEALIAALSERYSSHTLQELHVAIET